jgi:hypothetical protein
VFDYCVIKNERWLTLVATSQQRYIMFPHALANAVERIQQIMEVWKKLVTF